MKDSEKYRKWADTIDMCEGKTTPCFKTTTEGYHHYSVSLLLSHDNPVFPLAIVENKPVFVGDKLWHKDGFEYEVQDIEIASNGRKAFVTKIDPGADGDWINNYTWEKPDEHDEYAGYRRALKDGKKVAFYTEQCGGNWVISRKYDFSYPVDRYKIVDDDIVIASYVYNPFSKFVDSVKYTKSGLNGEITAEVVK
jgi:hypothetical protein